MAPRLKAPPIVEVVCGFIFAPLAGLDPLVVGKYWSKHKEKDGYREHQLHPAVSDRPGLSLTEGLGPLRCWLIKETDDYVLQIQPDRFYFNWRKRAEAYPHFTNQDGAEGVLAKSLREFAQFGQFCKEELALERTPAPVRFELAKVDLLVSPAHWKDYSDLNSVLPMLKQLPRITDEPTLSLSLVGPRDRFQVQFGLTNVGLSADMSPAVKMETQVTADASENAEVRLGAMNDTANEIFFGMIAEAEFGRFGGLIE